MSRQIYLIVHNVRSCYNVGSLLRTADALAVNMVFFSGYTPYPKLGNDNRLPHIADKLSRQIHKSALGAEDSVTWEHNENVKELIKKLRSQDILIVALEQTNDSLALPNFTTLKDVAIIVGREV